MREGFAATQIYSVLLKGSTVSLIMLYFACHYSNGCFLKVTESSGGFNGVFK